EVEFCGAWARRIGEEGRGVATIIEMVMLTRLDCMLGAAAEMRMALAQALHHARHRRAFGRRLVEQPLMANVLADLALESEASTALALRIARAVDAAARDPQEAAFARVATAIGKFWICRRAAGFVNEAQECLGGAGYIEESMLPRLYRQAPLNSIWEGSGNVQCLDVLRALSREPQSRQALLRELEQARGLDGAYDVAFAALQRRLDDTVAVVAEATARRVAASLAILLQAATLLRAGSPVACAFIASRLADSAPPAYGMLDATVSFADILERAWPSA
ncbi:MAG: DNA alkylation response protein, partial [Stenotrophomonas nitritireducens]|nr:DNA alkylation response protein [Stenotrophomonas nitritireducens]